MSVSATCKYFWDKTCEICRSLWQLCWPLVCLVGKHAGVFTEHVSVKLVTSLSAWLILVSLQFFSIPSHLYNVSVLLVSGKDETEASPLCDWEDAVKWSCFSFLLCGYSQIHLFYCLQRSFLSWPGELSQICLLVDSWLLIFVEGWRLGSPFIIFVTSSSETLIPVNSLLSPFIFKEISEISHQVISHFQRFYYYHHVYAWTSSFREYKFCKHLLENISRTIVGIYRSFIISVEFNWIWKDSNFLT